MSMYDLCDVTVQRLRGGHGSSETGGSWSDTGHEAGGSWSDRGHEAGWSWSDMGDTWLSDKKPEFF